MNNNDKDITPTLQRYSEVNKLKGVKTMEDHSEVSSRTGPTSVCLYH